MRKFLILLVVLALALGAVALFLVATATKGSAGIRFPLRPEQRELLSSVPADAGAFALIPAAASFHSKLASSPLTQRAVEEWSSRQDLPRPWMVGGADLVIWRSGKQTSYAVRLDPVRAALVRIWLMFGADVDARSSGGMFVINAPNTTPMGGQQLDAILGLVNGMPAGDALVVQQDDSRGAFPPIRRPAVTVVQVNRDDVVLISRSSTAAESPSEPTGGSRRTPFRARFPDGAIVAAQFAEPPRVAGDLDRLFGVKVSQLLADGGSIVLYDVNTRTLLPRPNGLFVVPATDASRDAVRKVGDVIGSIGQTDEVNGSIAVALDKQSLPAYRRERFVDASQQATDWAVRADPKRLVPLLDDLGDNTALRIATPRLYRSIRSLREWMGYLAAAEAVEAEHSEAAGVEELRVTISAK